MIRNFGSDIVSNRKSAAKASLPSNARSREALRIPTTDCKAFYQNLPKPFPPRALVQKRMASPSTEGQPAQALFSLMPRQFLFLEIDFPETEMRMLHPNRF